MGNHITLFTSLMQFIGSAGVRFHDIRIMVTFAWAIVGAILSESVHLGQWALFRPGQTSAASKVRQLSRWIHNDKIRPMQAYRPLVQAILRDFEGQTLYLALDTTLLWQRFVIIRVVLPYRGRALPLGWVVYPSGSATVSVERYQHVLAQVAELIPASCRVVLLADRGFMHVQLMQLLRQLNWHFRLRVKSSVKIHRATHRPTTVKALLPPPGHVRCFHYIWLTNQRFGPLYLVVGYVWTTKGLAHWAVVSDESVSVETLNEYERRFQIEENFLDDKSAGFQLESSEIEDSMGLSRLCLILASATLFLVSQGTALVEMGRRHWVDPHWERGLSYVQLGWRWVKRCAVLGGGLVCHIWLSPEPDPEPAMASKRRFMLSTRRITSVKQYL